ncbi:hypothetical protein BH18CHL2_BH18CHL2_00740 [soil metagenome]
MAVHDEEVARTRALGADLLGALQGREGVLLGYVVAADELDALAQAMRRAGLEPVGPIAMQRERADGRVLGWRLLFPRGQRWRDSTPFVIEWTTSDADRLEWDEPAAHPNGVTRVDELTMLVEDLPRAIAMHERAFGLGVAADGPGLARAAIGDMSVQLVGFEAAVPRELEQLGEGLAELTLGVRDMDQAAKRIAGLIPDADGRRYRIPESAALGVRLALIEVREPASRSLP